jgi:hypothetical protein
MKSKFLQWIPRIIAIGAILFMMLFSLDCFEEGNPWDQNMICFFMHNIPSYVCILALVIAWKWEAIGGVIFVAIFIAGGIFFNSFKGNPASLIVIVPFLIVGILFIIHALISKEQKIA